MGRTQGKILTQTRGVNVRRGGGRYVHGVIPMRPAICDMPGGGVTGKGAQPGLDPLTLHV